MQTENGLVEAVAVLVSTMPRLRPDLPAGKLGQCYKTRQDFIKVSLSFGFNCCQFYSLCLTSYVSIPRLGKNGKVMLINWITVHIGSSVDIAKLVRA